MTSFFFLRRGMKRQTRCKQVLVQSEQSDLAGTESLSVTDNYYYYKASAR